MRLAEARGETCAEDLELAAFPGKPELDAVPVDPRDPLDLASGDRRAPEPADMLDHLGKIMIGEHRDVAEQIVEAVGLLEIIELLPLPDEIAHGEHALA